MEIKEWARREVERAKLAEYIDPAGAANDQEIEVFRIENAYVDSIYDMALDLFNRVLDQKHSGASIGLTLKTFNRLASLRTLTPLTGEETEWGTELDRDAIEAGLQKYNQQNNRDSRVFRFLKEDGAYRYEYIEILNVINSQEVWQKYPPVDDPGTLDESHPLVQSYINERKRIRNELQASISFPYDPVTYLYYWDFEDQILKEVKR